VVSSSKLYVNIPTHNTVPRSYKCSGKFQIAPANPKDGSGNESDRLGGGNDGKERNEDDDNWREYGDEEREDTVSAPACVIHIFMQL
jgi:hypothetical protein